ncbi:MAG: hypothetical protein A3G41_04555 [Elusimicrobia bacterium RIFCSPLOWO2_12_FULL_59_9]|nr:MAG: hypothetical protein A3G41_04555 [Elusimicrobia bacterium RIFCSPLOWO2_12_FULL_59_9]
MPLLLQDILFFLYWTVAGYIFGWAWGQKKARYRGTAIAAEDLDKAVQAFMAILFGRTTL